MLAGYVFYFMKIRGLAFAGDGLRVRGTLFSSNLTLLSVGYVCCKVACARFPSIHHPQERAFGDEGSRYCYCYSSLQSTLLVRLHLLSLAGLVWGSVGCCHRGLLATKAHRRWISDSRWIV